MFNIKENKKDVGGKPFVFNSTKMIRFMDAYEIAERDII